MWEYYGFKFTPEDLQKDKIEEDLVKQLSLEANYIKDYIAYNIQYSTCWDSFKDFTDHIRGLYYDESEKYARQFPESVYYKRAFNTVLKHTLARNKLIVGDNRLDTETIELLKRYSNDAQDLGYYSRWMSVFNIWPNGSGSPVCALGKTVFYIQTWEDFSSSTDYKYYYEKAMNRLAEFLKLVNTSECSDMFKCLSPSGGNGLKYAYLNFLVNDGIKHLTTAFPKGFINASSIGDLGASRSFDISRDPIVYMHDLEESEFWKMLDYLVSDFFMNFNFIEWARVDKYQCTRCWADTAYCLTLWLNSHFDLIKKNRLVDENAIKCFISALTEWRSKPLIDSKSALFDQLTNIVEG